MGLNEHISKEFTVFLILYFVVVAKPYKTCSKKKRCECIITNEIEIKNPIKYVRL